MNNSFVNRHIGLSDADISTMLAELGYEIAQSNVAYILDKGEYL